MTPMYTVRNRLTPKGTFESLDDATRWAEQLLNELPEGTVQTFVVENEDGYLLAVLTNDRIQGTFAKQAWGGRKGNDAIFVGAETFDATDAVLLMDHKDLMQLRDHDESSDSLGREFVDWSGPCYVDVTSAIEAYFGVFSLDEITPEALAFVRARVSPQLQEEQTVTLTVKVRIAMAPGTSVSAFVEDLDYRVVSQTSGVVVRATELISAE